MSIHDVIAAAIQDAKPARDSLLASLAKSVKDRAEHEHPTWEDLYCLNLVSYMGERMAPVLRRLIDAETERDSLREKAEETVVYRASHDSIVMGLYTTAAAARAHCEAEERRTWSKSVALTFDWIEDEEDGVAELTVTADQDNEGVTGYVVTALTVASEYDEEADE